MWRRVMQWFGGGAGARYCDLALRDLTVAPDEGEDFDAEACRRLLAALDDRGGHTLEKVRGVAVPMELFFEGNRTEGSIAVLAVDNSPLAHAQEFYRFLLDLREHPGVHSIWVVIDVVEPEEDGVLHEWPYSDSLWIYSSLGREELLEMLKPIRPDELDALDPQNLPKDSVHLEGCQFPLLPIPAGQTAYFAWWE